jgi:S-adenosylmethionine-diacylglycerol 3-amino-3-carboxypropyl transferase
MRAEIAGRVDFSGIRYAQCWEDADVLLEGLDIRPHHVCLSIASAGDNVMAMVSRGPDRVIALDLSQAQIACLELRVASYRSRRVALYRHCRKLLSPDARRFWDAHPTEIARGVGGAGKFERYLALFRRRVLPLVHTRDRVQQFLRSRSRTERESFFDTHWDSWRWRLIFRAFFSRFLLGRLGRDPRFFDHVEGHIADHLLARLRYAAVALDPAENPYLHWILTGRHGAVLPYALRAENFGAIQANLDRLELRCQSLESFLGETGDGLIDRYNLSDIFEYMSPEGYHRVLDSLVRCGRDNSRLAYWNLLAARRRPPSMAARLRPLGDLARRLQAQDKAFFYSAFVLEEKP